MQRLGVMPSFSRPSVSNDNPFSESLFRTLKYCPLYPTTPFASPDAAREWMATCIHWYNDEHVHSGIRFTTPASRHIGTDTAILHNRDRVYHAAQCTHPSRWSGATRNWMKIKRVTLNGVQEGARSVRTASGRSRDRDPERFPQAEGRLIETGRAHPGRSGPTHGSDAPPIVDPSPHYSRALLLQSRIRRCDTLGRMFHSAQAGGLAARSVNILLETGALLPGACPRSEAGQAPTNRHE